MWKIRCIKLQQQGIPNINKWDTIDQKIFKNSNARTHITLGGETESSNPSRLIFSIKIPENIKKLKMIRQTRNKMQKKIKWHWDCYDSIYNLTGVHPFLGLQMILIVVQEEHLLQDLFQLLTKVDHQFYLQSTAVFL